MLVCISSILFATYSYDEATGTMDKGYPRSIEDDFPGMDDEVDAAVYHYGTVKPLIIFMNIQKEDFSCSSSVLHCLTLIPLCSLSGYLYFFHEHMQYEYSYNSRKVIRIMRTNSILNC